MKVKNFSLMHTVESGQFFQYEKEGEGYVIWVGEDIFYAQQQGNELIIEGIDEARAAHILSLDEDYEAILKSISKDTAIKEAIAHVQGMRNMRQDFYECLISYICSANNAIPNITRSVKLMSQFYGRPVTFRGKKFFLFPKPKLLCHHDRMLEAKTGFRAKYICAVNEIVDEAWIQHIKSLPYELAKEKLMELPGVGPKIADCVCLFALGHTEAFPIDVWIRRVMIEKYFKKEVSNGEIHRFARRYFGQYAGYAAQFLFYFRRKQ